MAPKHEGDEGSLGRAFLVTAAVAAQASCMRRWRRRRRRYAGREYVVQQLSPRGARRCTCSSRSCGWGPRPNSCAFVSTRPRSALCSDHGKAKASSGARRGARRGLGSDRWGEEAQQLDDAALEDAGVAAREGGARWEDRRWGAGWGERALAEAVRVAQRAHALRVGMAPTILLEPPMDELYALEWLASLPPSALHSWHAPRIEVTVITHRRPASLRRLLRSLACVPLLGDALDVTFSIEAGADEATLDLAHAFAAEWTAGTARAHERHAKDGLIAAVVEACTRHAS